MKFSFERPVAKGIARNSTRIHGMIDIKLYRHMKAPRGYGRLEDADAVGLAGSADRTGPFFCIYLSIRDATIRDVKFETYRCPWSMAGGSVLAGSVTGLELDKASKFGLENLLAEMGDVPAGKMECLSRAVEALKKALAEFTSRIASA